MSSEARAFCDDRGKAGSISAEHARHRLRAIVSLLGEEKLGFSKDDIGLHSIRSGGSMAVFLSGTPVVVMQRIGRWSNEAFLEHAREQVEAFELDVARKMLKFEEFRNLNIQNHDESSREARESLSEEATEENENGLDSAPLRVSFISLALGDESLTEQDAQVKMAKGKSHFVRKVGDWIAVL